MSVHRAGNLRYAKHKREESVGEGNSAVREFRVRWKSTTDLQHLHKGNCSVIFLAVAVTTKPNA